MSQPKENAGPYREGPGIKGATGPDRLPDRRCFGQRGARTGAGLESWTVTIKGHPTYMKLTGAFFKQTYFVELVSA